MFYPVTIEEVCIHPAYVGKDHGHGMESKKIECWKGDLCRVLNSVEFILPHKDVDGREMKKHGYSDFTECSHPQYFWMDTLLI